MWSTADWQPLLDRLSNTRLDSGMYEVISERHGHVKRMGGLTAGEARRHARVVRKLPGTVVTVVDSGTGEAVSGW